MQSIPGARARSVLLRYSGAVRRSSCMARHGGCAETDRWQMRGISDNGRKMHGITQWDLLIAHPPCTYLSNAGARHLWKGHQLQADRVMLGIQARDFFMRFWLADIPRIAVENPIPSRVFAMPEYTQTIQPYQFGHPYTKRTCLWLKNLPPLAPTNVVAPVATWCPSGSYSGKHGEQHKGMFTTDRAKNRAKTFEGIAAAMAEQWGCLSGLGTERV